MGIEHEDVEGVGDVGAIRDTTWGVLVPSGGEMRWSVLLCGGSTVMGRDKSVARGRETRRRWGGVVESTCTYRGIAWVVRSRSWTSRGGGSKSWAHRGGRGVSISS